MRSRRAPPLLVLVPAGLLAVPFVALGLLAVGALVDRGLAPLSAAFDAWTAPSSLASLPAAAGAGVLAAALGAGLGTFLVDARSPARRLLAVAVLLPLAWPPVFLGGVVADLTGLGPAPSTGAGAVLRWSALIVSQALSFAPLGALATWGALRAIPPGERKAARLLPSRWAAWRLSVWPALRGPLVLVAFAVFALAASDAVTPPHFGVETLASRLEQGFRLSLDAEASAVATFPVWAALATTLAIDLAFAPGVVPRGAGGGTPASARSSVFLASAYAAAALVLPLVHAARHAGLGREAGGLPAIAAKLGDELGATLLIVAAGVVLGAAAAAAFVAAAGAWPLSRSLPPSKDGGWGARLRRGAVWLALAVPFCAPGLWIGVVAVDLVARCSARADASVVAVALAFRVLPWAAVGILLAAPSRAAAGARAAGVPAGRRAGLLVREVGSAPFVVAGLAVAAAAAREVDLFAACSVPEAETLAVRAADALHYGFVAEAARPLLLQQTALLALAVLGVLGVGALARGRAWRAGRDDGRARA